MIQSPLALLQQYFGYENFRPGQQEIIEHCLSGQDTLVVMPTGGGKSICYQIPALIFDNLTLVISPLLSLMKDQVDSLKQNGIKAAYYNSSLSEFEKGILIDEAIDNQLKLLYIAPESLILAMSTWLRKVKISFVVIDEAHCVSMWGHDFRPEYQQIHQLRNLTGDIPVMAVTATADKLTRQDIVEKLALKNHNLFLSSFRRNNLNITVRSQVAKKDKVKEVLQFIQNQNENAGIIYCLSRKETEEWHEILLNHGIKSLIYHAGLSSNQRDENQEAFANDNVQVICATIAFGMGIDKSNVRWIIHNNLPKNIDCYYQEIGRAGRDGMPAETLLYYNMRDVILLNDFIKDSPQKEIMQNKIKRMVQFAESGSCRRNSVLAYFGEIETEPCNNCDNCITPPATITGNIIAQKAISAVKRLNEEVAMNMLINVLRGSKTAELIERKFDQIKTYGAGNEFSFQQWQHYLNQLINLGILEIAYDDFLRLKLTPLSYQVLENKFNVQLLEITEKEHITKKRKTEIEISKSDALLIALKDWRKKIAVKNKVPAYVILHDATLNELVLNMPKSNQELLSISGISQTKLDRFGDDILSIIKNYSGQVKEKKSTFEITYDLYKQGLTVNEIAAERNLNEQTIYGHLSRLYEDGAAIDLKKYITEYEIQLVKDAKKKLNNTIQMKPIYDKLEGTVSYTKIGIAMTILATDY